MPHVSQVIHGTLAETGLMKTGSVPDSQTGADIQRWY